MIDAGAFLRLETLQSRLISAPPPLVPARSDYDVNPEVPRGHALTPAAVLIAVVTHAEPTVLFTQRSIGLRRHAGQVSFPGGAADLTDASLTQTALRELTEETGIGPALVTIAGYLPPYETITGFAVLPVVGLLSEGFTLVTDAREVAAVFEVPLAFLIDPANCREESADFPGGTRRFYAFRYESHYIWGATAAMLHAFAGRLQ